MSYSYHNIQIRFPNICGFYSTYISPSVPKPLLCNYIIKMTDILCLHIKYINNIFQSLMLRTRNWAEHHWQRSMFSILLFFFIDILNEIHASSCKPCIIFNRNLSAVVELRREKILPSKFMKAPKIKALLQVHYRIMYVILLELLTRSLLDC